MSFLPNSRDASAFIPFGYAIRSVDLEDPYRRQAILTDCTAVTPEFEAKWDAICNADGKLCFKGLDRLAAFAQANALDFHGHTLCWHGAIPTRFRDAEPAQFRLAAASYLSNAVGRYRGTVASWHVVNEPLHLADGRPDGLRRTPYLEAFGANYIDDIFFLAAASDPQAILVINEMGLEYDSPAAEKKRQAMLGLLKGAIGRGAPIDCIGLQSHLVAKDYRAANHDAFANWLGRVGQLGVDVMITELDIDDRGLEMDEEKREGNVAGIYRDYVSLVRENARLRSVTVWGISDDCSWLNQQLGLEPAQPLIRDHQLRLKPAWFELNDLLSFGQGAQVRQASLS